MGRERTGGDAMPKLLATNRFEVRRKLGAGGMGIVYEAFDRQLESAVALKMLRHLDPQAVYLLKNEFRALQDIEHPNLVTLGELFEADGDWFFTMELLDGVDFLRHVRGADGAAGAVAGTDPTVHSHGRTAAAGDAMGATMRTPVGTDPGYVVGPSPARGSLDEARLRTALAQLAEGTAALHAAGKVHRDIKPSNVQVTTEERVVLLDFGLITDATGDRDSHQPLVAGTAPYMAPEQAASKPVGPEADCYAIGVMLYEALTGRLPFLGSAMHMLREKQRREPPPPSAVAAGIPEDLDRMCASLLKLDPAQRAGTAEILARLGARPTAVPAPAQVSEFVGRTRELQVLRDAFDASRRGATATVYVHGESGLGKSALIQQFAADLAARSRDPMALLTGRCYERESVPYKAFDGVVDSLSRYLIELPFSAAQRLLPADAELLPRVFPVLGRVDAIADAGRPEAVGDPLQLRTRVFAALRDLFKRLSDRCPVVVVIDDLQWADTDSLLLLAELVRAPAPPMLLLISSRLTPDELDATAPRALGADVRHLEIGPLPPDAARKLARRLVGDLPAGTDVSVTAVAMESGGHPMYIDALVRHIAATRGQHREKLRLGDAIVARAAAVTDEARRVLELTCVAGTPLPQETIRYAAELTPEEFFKQVAVLRAGRLVRTHGSLESDAIEPYHDRVRESIVEGLPEPRPSRHNADLAAALVTCELADTHPELMLRFLEHSGELGRAARYAVDAARRAGDALAFERAAALYRAALRLGEHTTAERRELLLNMAEALANAGRGAESAETYLDASEGADDDVRLASTQRAMIQLLEAGHIDRAFEILDRILVDIGVAKMQSPWRHFASLVWNRARIAMRGMRWQTRPADEVPPEVLRRIDTCAAIALGLGSVDTIRAADYASRGFALALKHGEESRVARAMTFDGLYTAALGSSKIDAGVAVLDKARPYVEASDDRSLHALLQLGDALIHYFAGRLARADRELEAAERRCADLRATMWMELNLTHSIRISANRLIGRISRMGPLLDRYLRDADRRGNLFSRTTFARNGNLVWLARDELDAARRALAEATWTPPAGQTHIQHFFEALALAELALYEGGGAKASRELEGTIDRFMRSLIPKAVQMTRADAFWLIGRLALAGVDAGENPAGLKIADRMWRKLRREDIAYARAWGQLLHAAVLLRRGNDAGAADALGDAIAAARESDMFLIGASARWRLGELIGGDEGARLLAATAAQMQAEDVAKPERITAVMAPGFGRP